MEIEEETNRLGVIQSSFILRHTLYYNNHCRQSSVYWVSEKQILNGLLFTTILICQRAKLGSESNNELGQVHKTTSDLE